MEEEDITAIEAKSLTIAEIKSKLSSAGVHLPAQKKPRAFYVELLEDLQQKKRKEKKEIKKRKDESKEKEDTSPEEVKVQKKVRIATPYPLKKRKSIGEEIETNRTKKIRRGMKEFSNKDMAGEIPIANEVEYYELD
jgi:hypothetical protein